MRRLFCFLILLAALNSQAQQTVPARQIITRREADSLRVDVIGRELRLSLEESRKFWPAYTDYTRDLEQLDREYFRRVGTFKRNIDQLNDSQLQEFIEQEFSFGQKRLDLKKKYNQIFSAILPVRKLAHLYIAQDLYSRQLIRYRISKGLNSSAPVQ